MSQFEDKFMDIQANMISLGMEYLQNQATAIYIYAIADGLLSFNIFYNIGDRIVKKHLVNDFLPASNQIDTGLQRPLLQMGTKDIEAIVALCKDYDRKCPTEMWLVYDVQNNSLDTKYSYDGRYEKNEDLLPRLEFEKWYEEVKQEVEGN